MHIDCGGTGYEWIEGWANLPATYSSRTGWSHHGLALTDSGKVVTYHQADGTVLVLDQDGNLERSWASGLAEGHGITAVKDGDAEFLWIADNGRKRTPATAYEYPESGAPTVGQVVKMSMDGETVLRLPTPPVDAYRDGDYMPTWVAVNEERHGGNGDVWVTDGYAVDLVHRYDKSGNYLGTITGEDGRAGKFNNPHAILMDTRKSEPELYVADGATAGCRSTTPKACSSVLSVRATSSSPAASPSPATTWSWPTSTPGSPSSTPTTPWYATWATTTTSLTSRAGPTT